MTNFKPCPKCNSQAESERYMQLHPNGHDWGRREKIICTNQKCRFEIDENMLGGDYSLSLIDEWNSIPRLTEALGDGWNK
jgi:hypothetical protein